MPIQVASATENHSISIHQYHLADQGRIRYRRICELEDRQVDESEIGKRYELAKDHVIPISHADLEDAAAHRKGRGDRGVHAAGIHGPDPHRHRLLPHPQRGQVAAKPYKLLREALGRSSRVAIAKWAWHGRERLGILRTGGDHLFLTRGIPGAQALQRCGQG